MVNKKIFVVITFSILSIYSCFAERKTRVDKYGDYQIKIIWSTNTTVGPTEKNWAKADWAFDSAIQYYYILNPKNSSGVSAATVSLYKNYNVPSYQKNCVVEVCVLKEGVEKDVYCYGYYPNEYNLALNDFDKWAKLYEMYISFDEMK